MVKPSNKDLYLVVISIRQYLYVYSQKEGDTIVSDYCKLFGEINIKRRRLLKICKVVFATCTKHFALKYRLLYGHVGLISAPTFNTASQCSKCSSVHQSCEHDNTPLPLLCAGSSKKTSTFDLCTVCVKWILKDIKNNNVVNIIRS